MADEQLPNAIELKVIQGPHVGESFVFDSHSVFVVGRSRQAHLSLQEDAHFSRYHFRLEIKPPVCHLVDLESRNGTYVNGEQVHEAMLSSGDEIHGGATRIQVNHTVTQTGHSTSSFSNAPQDVTAQWTPPVNADSPHNIGSYVIHREIGRGAMGIVYHATDQATRRQAAVKVIDGGTQPTTEQLELFIREANILSQLNHPRIVGFQEFGMHDGQLYLAMDYVETVDFLSILRKQTPVKQVRLACGIARYILDGLEYAHSKNLVHRDIKPANILCEKRDDRLFALLGDFGLAKNYLIAGLTQISQDDVAKGTPRYMSPEQILNCRYSKPPCDIYSLGVCLYEFLCGGPLFPDGTARSIIAKIINSQFEPLESRAPQLDPPLCAIVDRALAADPEQRYPSAAHFREALAPYAKK